MRLLAKGESHCSNRFEWSTLLAYGLMNTINECIMCLTHDVYAYLQLATTTQQNLSLSILTGAIFARKKPYSLFSRPLHLFATYPSRRTGRRRLVVRGCSAASWARLRGTGPCPAAVLERGRALRRPPQLVHSPYTRKSRLCTRPRCPGDR